MEELKKWQSLDRLCKDMLDLSFKLEDSIRLASQLVSQLELVVTSTRTGNFIQVEDLANRNEELA